MIMYGFGENWDAYSSDRPNPLGILILADTTASARHEPSPGFTRSSHEDRPEEGSCRADAEPAYLTISLRLEHS